jgi:hypothetical protein
MSNALPPENQTSSEPTPTNKDDISFLSPVDVEKSSNSSSSPNSKKLQSIIEISKKAILDVWSVFKFIWTDPANGLQVAINTLADTRIFHTGIALCLLFVLIEYVYF